MTRTSKITYTAIFAAIASVLMYFEFPLPFMPPFLQVDLSGVAVLIGAFIFGIRPAICMIIIKDVIHLTKSATGGSGELADVLMMTTLVVIAVSLYQLHKTRKMAVIGCLAGTVGMALVGMLTNNFLIIPYYTVAMGWPIEAIFELCSQVNPYIGSMWGYLLLGVLPFNLIKGLIITIITLVAYKKLSVFIKSKQISFGHSHSVEKT
ncbi:MAG: ECF transporter S component [Clostridiaceae bacterium]|nr:ECF transporter S component [Clostridiaceae bacterium]NBH77295.1 ECF transporter S component [Clostridiaceae bacterium]NBI80623.1 ECF transporter S component [Clostridiaceae bacterium]